VVIGRDHLDSGSVASPDPETESIRDGSDAERRIAKVLWNDPATGVMRHADAGYDIVLDCAREHQLNLPGITG